jgi:ParB family chromosome partitioning protein
MSANLAGLERAERLLAQAASPQDALDIISEAEVAKVYAKEARLGTASINHATVVKLRAERKLADIIDAGQQAGTIATQKDNERPTLLVRDPDKQMPARLEDLGIERQRLAEARKIRDAYTDAEITEIASEATDEDRCLTRQEFISRTAHVANNSGQNEWYTPAPIIEAARAAMGGIDLDPATSEIAQATVLATDYFTAEDDGLAREWYGGVWLNPPYSQPLIGQFIDKLLAEYTAGRVQRAVVLVNNATETAANQKLLGASLAVCFPAGRIKYLDETGAVAKTPLQGQLIAWLERDGKRDPFDSEFTRFGVVL